MPLEDQHVGHYRLLRQLSQSEGYEVYRAEDTRSSAQVIIELVKLTDTGHLVTKGKQKIHSDRIKQHLQTIRTSQHPRLVPVREAEATQIGGSNYVYAVTPYFKDGSLEDWWRVRSKRGSLTQQDADYIMQQATEAVQQLHSCGVAHQKLKLSSFLIQTTENPNRPDVFLDDFLLAALRSEEFVEDEVQRTEALGRDQAALQELEKLLGSSFREPIYTSVILQQTDTISDEEIAKLRRGIDTPRAEHNQLATGAGESTAALAGLPIPQAGLQQGVRSAERENEEEERIRHLREHEEEERLRRERREREEKKARLRRELQELEEEDQLLYERRDMRDDDIKLLASAILAAVSAGGAATAGSGSAAIASAESNSGFLSRRRPWLPLALLLLLLLLAGALCLLASLFFFVKPIWAAGSSSARVTIVQANYELTSSYVFTGKTRSLSQANTQSIKVAATNVVFTAGIQAGGALTFHNTQKGKCSCPIVIPAGTVFTSTHGVSVVTDRAAILGSLCTVSVPAHAQQSGPAADIAAHEIHQTYLSSILVDNNAAFTGGQFGQSFVAVQQSDIDHAASRLLGLLKQSTLASLKSQLLTNEQFVTSPVCKSKVNSNHQASDIATSLTVTVTETCKAESYYYQTIATGAQAMLKDRAKALFGSYYALTGDITTTLSHIATDAKQGTLLSVDASGLWTYHVSNAHIGQLARLIAGKNTEDARSILSRQQGVQSVSIDISGDDQKTLPNNAGSISIDYVTTNVPINEGSSSTSSV